MTKRETRIPDNNQVNLVRDRLRSILPPQAKILMKSMGINCEEIIRWMPLAQHYERTREEMGVSIKEAAKSLKVPHYRIKAIEKGHFQEIRPDVLLAYTDLLGLQSWLSQWKDANPRLADKIFCGGTRRRTRAPGKE